MQKSKLYLYLPIIFASILFIPFNGCKKGTNPVNSSTSGIHYGIPVVMNAGTIKSFIETDSYGTPLSLGIVLSDSALINIDTVASAYNLSLPKIFNFSQFDHIIVKWNPNGPSPSTVYNVPHFDFYFYMISTDVQNSITGISADSTKMYLRPENRYVPTDYAIIRGSGKPGTGVFYYDTTAPEFHGQQFTKSFLYCFYDGGMILMEPIITKAFLLSKPDYIGTVKQPRNYPKTGFYPDKYNVKYDTSKKEYVVSLINLTKH